MSHSRERTFVVEPLCCSLVRLCEDASGLYSQLMMIIQKRLLTASSYCGNSIHNSNEQQQQWRGGGAFVKKRLETIGNQVAALLMAQYILSSPALDQQDGEQLVRWVIELLPSAPTQVACYGYKMLRQGVAPNRRFRTALKHQLLHQNLIPLLTNASLLKLIPRNEEVGETSGGLFYYEHFNDISTTTAPTYTIGVASYLAKVHLCKQPNGWVVNRTTTTSSSSSRVDAWDWIQEDVFLSNAVESVRLLGESFGCFLSLCTE